MLREGLVEGGIEYRYLGGVREQLLGDFDAEHSAGVVQRGEVAARFHATDDVRRDDGRGGEILATMDDAVADGVGVSFKCAVLFEGCDYGLERLLVVGSRHGKGQTAVREFECDVGFRCVQTLAQAGGTSP